MKNFVQFFAWIGGWDYRLFLEYVKVLLSWPPLALVAFLFFVRAFNQQIGDFLTGGRAKIPGHEWKSPLVNQRVDEPPKPDDDAVPEPVAAQEPLDIGPQIEAEEPPPDQLGANTRLVEALARRNTITENFRYLNQLLAIPTQYFLDTLVMAGEIKVDEFNDTWSIISASNRSNILTVLYQHGLIIIEGSNIYPTDKAEEYIKWPERNSWVSTQRKILLESSFNEPMSRKWNIISDTMPGNIYGLAGMSPSASTSPSSVDSSSTRRATFGATAEHFRSHSDMGKSHPSQESEE